MSKLTMIAVAVLALGLGVFIWNGTRPVDDVAGDSMASPDVSAIKQGAPIVTVKLPSQLSDSAQIGKRAFDVKCAVCHGENAAGQKGVAPPLVHKIYEPSHHSDMAFVLAVQNGVRSHHWKFGSMPPVEGLTRSDALMIAAYVRELQRAIGIE